MSTPFDEFYASPSPSLAVALAIADHKAYRVGPVWEYVEQLQKAQDRCNAYPKLVAKMHRAIIRLEDLRISAPHQALETEREIAEFTDLLRTLGESN